MSLSLFHFRLNVVTFFDLGGFYLMFQQQDDQNVSKVNTDLVLRHMAPICGFSFGSKYAFPSTIIGYH